MVEILEVTRTDIAFGGDVKKLLPEWASIPDEFKKDSNKFCRIVLDWFYSGLSKDVEFIPKEKTDPAKALQHIKAAMSSMTPSHEHKIAGCAYLLSEWFIEIRNKGVSNEA